LPFCPNWIELPEIVRTDVGTFTELDKCRLEFLEGIPVGVAIADLHGSIISVRGHYEGADHACKLGFCLLLSLPFCPNWIELPEIVRTDVGTFTELDKCRLEFLEGIPVGVAIADLHGSIISVRGHYEGADHACKLRILFAERQKYYLTTGDVKVSSQLEHNSPICVPEIKSLFTAERGSVDTGVEIRGLKSDTSLIQVKLKEVCKPRCASLLRTVPYASQRRRSGR
ncbi:hypothetical protein OSTOST_11428, partial [Ostertagia ostertagi]